MPARCHLADEGGARRAHHHQIRMTPPARPNRQRACTVRHRAQLVLAIVGMAACGTRESDTRAEHARSATDSGTASASHGVSPAPVATIDSAPQAPPPPATPARNADQRLLRDLVDVHETISAIVHERMSARHDDHGMKAGMAGMPPDSVRNVGFLDTDIDREKVELLARLKNVYGDDYRARLPSPAARRVDSLARANETTGDSAYQAQLVSLLRREVALIDAGRPSLQEAGTRAIVTRHRADAKRRLELFTRPAAH